MNLMVCIMLSLAFGSYFVWSIYDLVIKIRALKLKKEPIKVVVVPTCSYCGKEIPDNYLKDNCKFCGAPLPEEYRNKVKIISSVSNIFKGGN